MERLVSRVTVLVLAVLAVFAVLGSLTPVRADSASTPIEVESYIVQPGQTLWSYAEMVTPEGGDVNESMDELMALNHLDDASLQVGQRIIVPADDTGDDAGDDAGDPGATGTTDANDGAKPRGR